MFSSSLKTLGETLQFPPTLFPEDWQWLNYVDAIQSMPFWNFLTNSLIVTLTTIILQFITTITAAYAFARYRFVGEKVMFGLVMVSMMVPGQLTFLTIFVMFAEWEIINTLPTLILPFAISAFGIFMLRQTFRSIPNEIIEAAKLDNATEFTVIRKVMLPMAIPTLVTLGLLTFIGTWNEYFWPLVLTTNNDARTLPVGIVAMINAEDGTNYHTMMASNVLLVIPILIIYLFAQRHIIKAFTYSGGR